ncbi:MAG: ABC transporter ATP-binding protein [Candidatus Phaeomarinobacter sp.]
MTAVQASDQSSKVSELLRPIRGRLWLACLLQGVSSAAGVVPFIAVAELGRVFLAGNTEDMTNAWWIAGLTLVALAVRLVLMMAAGGLTHLADLDLQLHLRRRMAAQLSRVPLGWFADRNAGAVKKALQDDVGTMHHLVGHAYTNMVSAIVTPLVALGYLIWVDWRLAGLAAVPLVLGAGIFALQYRGYGEKMAAYNAALEDVNAASVEFVQGIAVIKTFGQARKAYGRFIERTDAFVAYFWEWVRGLLAMSATAEVVLSPLFALVLVLGGSVALVIAGLVTPVDVLAVIVLAPGLTAPVLTMSYSQNEMMLANEAAARIATLRNTPTLDQTQEPRSPEGARVVFSDVSFSYGGDVNALSDIDLVLEPGTVTALVGPSGSGKSTLARLVPRFWDANSGSISIGGGPVDEMHPDERYRSVGFVFQHVQLLRASIAENIALGNPGASRADIEAAARSAPIDARIQTLPRGYDSIVGEDAHLSGGEAQRVSIARALLADAPVLILDEATAFADPESEASIQDALSQLVAGRTLLVIAHRLHTIVGADQICVMDKGSIVERGAHADLLRRDGVYTRLWAASETALEGKTEAAQ